MRKIRKLTRRNTKEKPTAILTADWHIREDQPVCRTDNLWEAQSRKVDFIFDLARSNRTPIIIAGDVGDKPIWSCRLLEWFITKVEEYDVNIFAIPGQHDLINHNIDLWRHSAIGVLHAAQVLTLLGPGDLQSSWSFNDFCINAFPYGREVRYVKPLDLNIRQIAITHQMVVKNKLLWADQKAAKSHQLLKRFSKFSIIHSGDNHLSFVTEHKERKLINPGSMMRTSADQINHQPRVYIWYAKSNSIKAIYLPIEEGIITREHIEERDERDERVEAYVIRMREDYEVHLSFERNMEQHLNINPISRHTKSIIYEAME